MEAGTMQHLDVKGPSTEANTAGKVGLAVTQAPQAPPLPKSAAVSASIASQVNLKTAAKAPIPPGMGTGKTTKNLDSIWMRAMIYGETNARKTSTAVTFGSTDDVRIILTRAEDQLIPLIGLDYKYEFCDTMQKLRYAMLYPENLWPDWASRAEPIIVVDDITKAKDMMLDSNEYNEKGVRQNNMLIHRESKAEMAELMKSLFNKPMHVICTAFANIYENPITHDENVGPDIPPAMLRMLSADFSFCFYIDKAKWMFRTNDFRETYTDVDEKMVSRTFTRIILAKHKIPKHLVGKGVINDLEKMDLADIWRRIRAANTASK